MRERLDRVVPALLERCRVPGAAVALVENGAVSPTAAFGWADPAQRRPVFGDTVFQAASLAKPVTAWAAMQLIEAGRLSLDAPIGNVLTGWRLPPAPFPAEAVTIGRIMSHSAGLSLSDYPGEDPSLPAAPRAVALFGPPDDALRQIIPAGGFRYSGGGWSLLQLVIEELTGAPFATHMALHVLFPLGLAASAFGFTPAIACVIATPFAGDGSALPVYRYQAAAAAGLYATAGDLARFLAAHMTGRNGAPAGRGILSPAGLAALIAPRVATGGQDGLWPWYGSGYEIARRDGRRLIGHSGVNRGWRARMAALPDSGSGIAILTNSDNGGALIDALIEDWVRTAC
jgi:CubicO group peptidase (beta-lactamase class C family)